MKNVGGQAVLEGVMMRGSHCVATSVRTPEGMIETLTEPIKYHQSSLRKTPILRGIFNLVDSLATGMRVMNFSTQFFEEEVEEPSKLENWLDKISKGKSQKIFQGVTIGVSLAIALLFFTVMPTFLARLVIEPVGNRMALNLLEALIKVVLFIAYLFGISKLPEIHRVFMYHGAEHKVIDAYEHGLELTTENVRKSSRYHARCGTNFMFLVLMVSILIFTFVPSANPFIRVFAKILLIPLISGITFELIVWLGANNSALSKAISLPGKMMQRFTTAEPDDSMIEVAITALKRSENLPWTIKELKAFADERLKGLEGAALDRDVILEHVTGFDRAYLMAHPEATVSYAKFEGFKELINKRHNHMPVSYITGHKEFMGLDFIVNEHTLIPRPDTETLVEEVSLLIEALANKQDSIRILDLCSGSGAIGLSLAHRFPQIELVLADISPRAMAVARMNAQNLGLNQQTDFKVGDLFAAIKGADDFDVIVSNPPYITSHDMRSLPRDVREYEPRQALDGGGSGLEFYEKISDKARQYLVDGGSLYFEIGANQGQDVSDLLRQFNWQDIEVINDLAGKSRVVRASWVRDL